MIDKLLAAPEFNDKWGVWFEDLVGMTENLSTSNRRPAHRRPELSSTSGFANSCQNNRPIAEIVDEDHHVGRKQLLYRECSRELHGRWQRRYGPGAGHLRHATREERHVVSWDLATMTAFSATAGATTGAVDRLGNRELLALTPNAWPRILRALA